MTTRRALPLIAAVVITAYAGLLRLNVIVGRYGAPTHPAWAARLCRVAPLARHLEPAMWAWPPVAHPYVGGDPINYLRYAREMRSFYQAHVREPAFLAWTRGWLRLLDDQDVAVSFASASASLVVVLATYLLGAAAFSPAIGLLAAAALAIDYDAVSWAAEGWRDDFFSATFVLSALAIVKLRHEAWSPRRIAAAGTICAVSTLTRLTALSFIVPALLLMTVDAPREHRPQVARASLATLLIVAALVAPYLINCWRVFGNPLVAIDAHTAYYRHAEALPSEAPQSAFVYIGTKIRHNPLETLDTVLTGLFIHSVTNKGTGYDVWVAGSPHLLLVCTAAGLVLFGASAEGRLLLVVAFASLVPYAFTWNIGGGSEWRFTMHSYSIWLLAAAYPFVGAARLARRRRLREVFADKTAVLAVAALAVCVAAGWMLHRVLPWHVSREALAARGAVTVEAGPRDAQFFTSGWSGAHADGNVTSRVTTANRATLLLPLPSANDYRLTLRADPVRPDEHQSVAILLNGILVGRFSLTWDPERVGRYEIPVSAGVTHPGANDLTIVTDRLFPAQATGSRYAWVAPGASIGVRVWYVRLETNRAGR